MTAMPAGEVKPQHIAYLILTAELDILVPAAVGGVLTRTVAPRLRCRLIVGPANNQLATVEQHGLTEEQVAP